MAERRHTVIAGTGRAGTSFLVQFLGACGLDTGAEEDSWHPRARAGFEHQLRDDRELPYVVKDPWLFAYYEDLDLDRLRIDALILPLRDLLSAARSRVHQERLALTETPMLERGRFQVAGNTPGGALFSLSVVDQARLLAVGFYDLLHWAVDHDLPVYLLSFPRMVQDGEYLIRALSPWLEQQCSTEAAHRAFEAVAAEELIRIRAEPSPGEEAPTPDVPEPDASVLDHAAFVERIAELTASQTRVQEALGEAESRLAAAEGEREQLRSEVVQLAQARQQLEALRASTTWRVRARLHQHPRLIRLLRALARLPAGRA